MHEFTMTPASGHKWLSKLKCPPLQHMVMVRGGTSCAGNFHSFKALFTSDCDITHEKLALSM